MLGHAARLTALAAALFAAVGGHAFAASTAAQVLPGFLTMTPQPNCPVGPCYLPWDGTNPLPVAPTGGSGNAAITAPLGAQAPAAGVAVTPTSLYPGAATPITASATGTTAATTATLAGATGKTTYICGWSIDADATAVTVGAATVTGVVSGTLNRRQGVAAAAAGTASTYQVYAPCLPASAANTAIAVVSAAAGAGGNTAVTAWGYQQ